MKFVLLPVLQDNTTFSKPTFIKRGRLFRLQFAYFRYLFGWEMVKLSCGYKCLQCMLIVFNAIIIGCGIALIVVGSIAEVNLKKYSGTDDAYLHGFVIFVIAFGCFLTVLGIFGFCGACKKSVYCLTMGCVDATEQFLKKNILAVALCVFFFALLQILCMVFAICVIQAIKRGEDA
ncbi:hypothetical protein PHET_03886 [Paragonimus heterotremus]|uniref:Uncharacterized protein n=1 Tax=Paragonimus heterotremus TaxID=100268 RepID=A0A8J4WIZ9_9TREM|nr:hypothetical protein PHET_03886 [Paragonimus heterotremus]